MKLNISKYEINLKLRFLFFATFLVFIPIFLFVSSKNLKKESEVLAAKSNEVHSAPELIEADSTVEETSSDISKFQPVTISHTVEEGDTVYSIADKYHADAQTIVDYPPNEIGDNIALTVGQVLIIPNGYIDTPPIIPIAKGNGMFSWPVKGVISQHAFWWHPGAIDIAAKIGTPIYSAYSGRVIKVENWTTGYGRHVIVEHSDGYTTLYGHMSQSLVSVGQIVNPGTKLGLVGSTGRSTGPHLHFEVRKNGQPVDPMTLLSEQ